MMKWLCSVCVQYGCSLRMDLKAFILFNFFFFSVSVSIYKNMWCAVNLFDLPQSSPEYCQMIFYCFVFICIIYFRLVLVLYQSVHKYQIIKQKWFDSIAHTHTHNETRICGGILFQCKLMKLDVY